MPGFCRRTISKCWQAMVHKFNLCAKPRTVYAVDIVQRMVSNSPSLAERSESARLGITQQPFLWI